MRLDLPAFLGIVVVVDVEPPTRFVMSPPYGVVSGCTILCLLCFFLVLLVQVTHAVQSLTKSDRCFINAKCAFGATVRKLFNFGVRFTTNDVRCFMVFSAKSRRLVLSHWFIVFPTHETVK